MSEFISELIQGQTKMLLRILQHVEDRQRIKQIYKIKGIQVLDRPQLLFSDIKDPQLKPTQNQIYQAMKNELSKMNYCEFRFLGVGAQGLVLLAKEQNTNRRYAIKGIQVRDSGGKADEEIMQQVQSEITLLKKCRGSPYVVNLLNQIDGKEFIYLILNECQGTLKEIYEHNNQRLNELSAIKYAKDIAEGLHFIHSQPCLVNDLKMDNILIDYNGNAVISDFGFADKLAQKSGYSMNEYKGNILFQAPECYDPKDFNLYSEKYAELGLEIKVEPSNRSEACSLGYIIYAMIQRADHKLIYSKHEPLKYSNDFQQLKYKKQLQYIIDGLTKFVPRERLHIEEVLILLKGIISFEFDLDKKFVEIMEGNEAQEYFKSCQNEVELVCSYADKFYPIIKNEKYFIEQLNLQINEKQKKQEDLVSELNKSNFKFKQKIQKLEENIQFQSNNLQLTKIDLQFQKTNNQINQSASKLNEQKTNQIKREQNEDENIENQKTKIVKVGKITINPWRHLSQQKERQQLNTISIRQLEDEMIPVYSKGFFKDVRVGRIQGKDMYKKRIPLYDVDILNKRIGFVQQIDWKLEQFEDQTCLDDSGICYDLLNLLCCCIDKQTESVLICRYELY